MKPYQIHLLKELSNEIFEYLSSEDFQKAKKHSEFLKEFLKDIECLEEKESNS